MCLLPGGAWSFVRKSTTDAPLGSIKLMSGAMSAVEFYTGVPVISNIFAV